MRAMDRACGNCGATDRYPSGPCRPCTKRRNAENADYHVNRNRQRRAIGIEEARRESARTGYIYGLFEPTSDLIRYVGQTQQGLRRRRSGHILGPRRLSAHLPVNRWIAKLHAAGQEFEIRALEGPLHVADLDEAERRWIANLRAEGADLLNLCSGGRASLGTWSHREEAIRRSAEAKRGKPRPPEVRAKLSAANRGKKADPEVVARRAASNRGRKQAPEWIAKRVASVAATKARKKAVADVVR